MAVEKHGKIENFLHGCLDMPFQENYHCIRKDLFTVNIAVVGQIASDCFTAG